MSKTIRLGLVSGLFLAILVVGVFFLRSYWRDLAECQNSYTEIVKRHDIVDTANNSLAALDDAAVQVLHYILTGETVYRVAYAKDVQRFETEAGTLGIVAANDKAGAIVQNFLKAGPRTMEELAAVVAVYEKSGQQAALERIRRSSGITYLNEAREAVGEIKLADGPGHDGTARLIGRMMTSFSHLLKGGEALAALAISAVCLLILEMRRTA